MQPDIPKPSFLSSPTALHLMGLSIFAYAWQTRGLGVGLLFAAIFYVGVPVLNMLALAGSKSLRLGTYLRLALYIGLMLLIASWSSEICDSSGNCRSAF
ncbi:hypothetical protein [Novosphingobium sp. PASSN1]|uniref:hypothetical protein n=1 Tax=Novosphingobium sp. PASSN1 TaxID=2015561 RepID=UPI0025E38563|nr:hypothetical protein [Novosphingobium sp. PASSN1]